MKNHTAWACVLRTITVALGLALFAGAFAFSDEREDLERSLAHALEQGDRALLTEETDLPASGKATEPALVFLLSRHCVRVKAVAGKNVWTVGRGCGEECHIGKFRSILRPGIGLICRVARQTDFQVLGYTPPADDAKGDHRTRLEYQARLVDVAEWAQDPAYAAIWTSYGLNFATFHAFADMVKSGDGWIPYE
jgi:hypothetical protein